MNEHTNGTEVVIHITDTLDAAKRDALTGDLKKRNGIFSAAFCPLRYHLMLVEYNSRGINSQDVLGYIKSQHITASLIGPI